MSSLGVIGLVFLLSGMFSSNPTMIIMGIVFFCSGAMSSKS